MLTKKERIKKFGEVFSPPSLVDDMLDKLPKEVWSDPKLKWLDNSCGAGVFLWHGLIPRLMDGLSKKIPNEEKRKAHIAGMIYGVDIQLINVGITRSYLVKMLGSENLKTIKKQVVCHDSLTFNYWNDTKFDILVGNPPYNGGVDLKFLTLAIEKLDVKHLLYVHPSTYLIDRKDGARYNKIKNLLDGKLKSATLFNGNPVFNIGLFVPCVIIDYDRDYSGKCSIEYFEDKFKADVNNITKFGKEWATLINPFMTLMEAACADESNIRDKRLPRRNMSSLIKKNKEYAQLASTRGHVYVSSCADKNANIVKDDFYTLVMKNSDDNKGIRKESGMPTLEFNSKNERDNFVDYCKTYFARFCLALLKNKSDNDRGEMALIPWLDFTQPWDDKKLFKHFGIDKETQDYIKKFLPEYYV